MPKTEKDKTPKISPPPAAQSTVKGDDQEERLEALHRKIARLNREAEALAAAMNQKMKK